MKGFFIIAGPLLLLAMASAVSAGNESGYQGPDYLPEPYGLGYPARGHAVPPAHPMSRRYIYNAPARIHVQKAMYEGGYLLRVYTRGITPEDIEVIADRGRLRLRSERSRQSEWQSEMPYRRSSMSTRSSIRRTLRLPYNADATRLTTSVEEGVLEIRIPAKEAPDP
jgi:HSP20 family molecular chaperone IbpA